MKMYVQYLPYKNMVLEREHYIYATAFFLRKQVKYVLAIVRIFSLILITFFALIIFQSTFWTFCQACSNSEGPNGIPNINYSIHDFLNLFVAS